MAEEEQDSSVEETAGSKKKLIVIVGAAVLLVVIAAAGLYFSVFFDTEDEAVATEMSDSSNNESTEKEGDEGELETTATLYQALTPPFMVNFQEGNIKIMKVAISIMAGDEAVIEAVKKHDPIIRNNILMLLSAQDPEVLKTADGKADLQSYVKEEINKVLLNRKAPSKVKEVFFTDLVMQ